MLGSQFSSENIHSLGVQRFVTEQRVKASSPQVFDQKLSFDSNHNGLVLSAGRSAAINNNLELGKAEPHFSMASPLIQKNLLAKAPHVLLQQNELQH